MLVLLTLQRVLSLLHSHVLCQRSAAGVGGSNLACTLQNAAALVSLQACMPGCMLLQSHRSVSSLSKLPLMAWQR
jgi:hypothetical protein